MSCDHRATSEQKLGDLFGSLLHQLNELKDEVQNNNLVQEGRDFFDLTHLRSTPDDKKIHEYLPSSAIKDSFEALSLQLRVALPDIRAQCPGPYIQEILVESRKIDLKLGDRTVDIHRPEDAKFIYIISGGGIFGPLHDIKPVALLLRNWLLDILRNLAVLRGICVLSQSSGSMFGSSNVATVLDQAKVSFVSSNPHVRAPGPGSWLVTTGLRQDVEYAPNTLGSLITTRSHDLRAAVPNPRERPEWHKSLVNDSVKLYESISKDAAIAIAHNENADNPWRCALFQDMSPSQAVRTQGQIVHQHLENADAFFQELESKIKAEPGLLEQLSSLEDVYLVTGTSSLLLDGGVIRVHDHKSTRETFDRTGNDMIVRITTAKEVDVTVETMSVASENMYCFALEVLKVGMVKGEEEVDKLAMTLEQRAAGKFELLDFKHPKDTPTKATALEGPGTHADSGAGAGSDAAVAAAASSDTPAGFDTIAGPSTHAASNAFAETVQMQGVTDDGGDPCTMRWRNAGTGSRTPPSATHSHEASSHGHTHEGYLSRHH